MGCFGIVTAWLESHRARKPDGTANQSRKMKKAEKKMQKEMKERAKKEKKAAAKEKKAHQQQPSRTSARRHRSPPPTPEARRPLRSPPQTRCMTPSDMAADLEESTGLKVNVSDSGIAYFLDFRPGGTPARNRLTPLWRRCAFSFEEDALIKDILRQEQIINSKETTRQESVKRLEAERRRLETQTEKCAMVKQGKSKFVQSVEKRKKNLKKLAQTTLNLRADLVLKSVRTKRAMRELERRELEREKVLDEKGDEEGELDHE